MINRKRIGKRRMSGNLSFRSRRFRESTGTSASTSKRRRLGFGRRRRSVPVLFFAIVVIFVVFFVFVRAKDNCSASFLLQLLVLFVRHFFVHLIFTFRETRHF